MRCPALTVRVAWCTMQLGGVPGGASSAGG